MITTCRISRKARQNHQDKAYRQIFVSMQFAPCINQSLLHQFDAQQEYERSYNHYWNESDNNWTDNHDPCSSSCKHDSCHTRVAAAVNEQKTVCIYKVVLV